MNPSDYKRTAIAVFAKDFSVELNETNKGTFVIKTITPSKLHYSESILNFSTASLLFDLKVREFNATYP